MNAGPWRLREPWKEDPEPVSIRTSGADLFDRPPFALFDRPLHKGFKPSAIVSLEARQVEGAGASAALATVAA
jgi:hypothetical protein